MRAWITDARCDDGKVCCGTTQVVILLAQLGQTVKCEDSQLNADGNKDGKNHERRDLSDAKENSNGQRVTEDATNETCLVCGSLVCTTRGCQIVVRCGICHKSTLDGGVGMPVHSRSVGTGGRSNSESFIHVQ